MEIGGKFGNIISYNENMAKGMEDKVFFLSELPKNEDYIFVDFGCADGTLINYLVNIYNHYYTNTYIGYDISDTMIDIAKTNFNGNAGDVLFTSNWEEVKNKINNIYISYKKKVLILSSVIHEVYSYAESSDDIDLFWNRILNCEFDYICIRDMMVSKDIDRKDSTYDNNLNDHLDSSQNIKTYNEFREKYKDMNNVKNVVHYLLKYRWIVNWERELNENYFPIYIEDFLPKFNEKYNLTYFKRFRVPFLDECIKKDFNIILEDYTHIKAIFEIKKNASNI